MQFDFAELAPSERYRILTSVVVPRPIAWVTSLNAENVVNAAPFSFYNVFGSNPGLVVLGIGNRSNGGPKDTVRNIELRQTFVVNTVTEPLAKQMVQTSFEYDHGASELAAVGLTTAPSVKVAPPRIAESPVALECKLVEIHPVGGNRLIIGEVLHATIADAFYDAETRHIHIENMGIVGRMHGADGYTKTTELFHLPRPDAP